MKGHGKQCLGCGIWKPLHDYHKQGDGYRGRCKLCRRTEEQPKDRRIQAQTRRYGITAERYAVMIAEQGNRCLICQVDLSTLAPKHIHIDHCHSTGEVRGILCNNCNRGLGAFKDDLKLMLQGCKYLIEAEEKGCYNGQRHSA